MIVGLLLAAGGARRFGSQKLVEPLDGVPLVRHAANALAAATDAMIAVVGFEADVVRAALDGTGATIVENREWRTGLASSLRCAVAAIPPGAQAAIVALGDQPRMDVDLFRRVVEGWRETESPIVSARFQGVRGHPVLFDRSVFGELLSASGDAGARSLIESMPGRVAYVDVDLPMPSDVDSPADLAALARSHSPRGAGGGNVGPHQSN